MKKLTQIDIILQNRIGDTILSLPAIICLKQLIQAYGPDNIDISAFLLCDLKKILEAYNICKIEQMNSWNKIKSWIFPSDKAFFLCTTSQTMGFHSKKSYGEIIKHKKYARFNVNMPYLYFPEIKNSFPENLFSFLREKFNLSTCSIRYFGICLELGYSVEQIKETFHFAPETLSLQKDFSNWDPLATIGSDYLVFCMEAAYGKKRDLDRCWQESCYYELAEFAFEKFGLSSVFIGINKKAAVPKKPYMIDLRKKLVLKDIAQLLRNSKAYVGNDTGPLHVANLMKTNSLAIYFRENSLFEYNPLFSQYNTSILNPTDAEELFPVLERILTR